MAQTTDEIGNHLFISTDKLSQACSETARETARPHDCIMHMYVLVHIQLLYRADH